MKPRYLLLLATLSCSPQPGGIACLNPDPASGVCRDAELAKAEKESEQREQDQSAARLVELKASFQLASKQLADKKAEIAAADDPQHVTRLIREHDAIVAKMNSYLSEAAYDHSEKLGSLPEMLGEIRTAVTLQLQPQPQSPALLPVLGGLDAASEVELHYGKMQQKFPPAAVAGLAAFPTAVALPATLRIPLRVRFALNKALYCGVILIKAARMGGKVTTKLASEGGC